MDSGSNSTSCSTTFETDYDEILDNISDEDISAELEFLGEKKMTIRTTNAQEIYNHYQMFPKILVFDLRDSKLYSK
jgi:hypothetical protein